HTLDLLYFPTRRSSDLGVVSTMERFVAYLIEEYKGAFPTWLAPVQAKLIPVNDEAHGDHVEEIRRRMKAAGMRVEVDNRNEKMGDRKSTRLNSSHVSIS